MDRLDPFLVVEVVQDDVGEFSGQGLLHQPWGGGTA